jgi:DNA-binding GntR family transcriptional regulator
MTKNEILIDLRKKILEEYYVQGQSLVERNLCETYGVSRTPIREVLWSLVADGVVEQRPAGGFSVRKLDWKKVFEIFQAREAVEGMAARLASKQSDEESLKTLEKLRDELKDVDIEQDSIEGTRIGRLMHQEIIKAASNQLLSDIYVKLSYLSALTTNIAKHNVRTEQASKTHHLAIMDAIISGDAQNSEHYMRQHLKVTCRNLIEILYPQFVSAITEGIDTGFAL